METDLEVVTFTAHDRCDRCLAQALTVARLDGYELMFCWHHKDEFEDSLLKAGWTVISDHGTYESYREPVRV